MNNRSSVRLAPAAYESSEVFSNTHVTSAIELDSAKLIEIATPTPSTVSSPSRNDSYSGKFLI